MTPQPEAEFFVRNEGVRLACMDYGGDGPPVILLHGAGRNLGEWLTIGPRLARRHHVVSMDLRGHGASDTVDEFGWDAALSDVEALVAATGLARPYVVGHSLGGVIAVLYGLRHPEGPGVVNIDGFPSVQPYLSAAEIERNESFRAAIATERGPDQGPAGWLEAVLANIQDGRAMRGMHLGLSEPFVRRHYHKDAGGLFHRRPTDALMRSIATCFDSLDLLGAYRDLGCPALVLNCRRVDPSHPLFDLMTRYRLEVRRDLAAVEAQNPRVHVVDYDTGHMITVERPDAVVDETLRFFGALDPAG